MLRYPTPQSVEGAPNYDDEGRFSAAPYDEWDEAEGKPQAETIANARKAAERINRSDPGIASVDYDESAHLVFVQINAATQARLRKALNKCAEYEIE